MLRGNHETEPCNSDPRYQEGSFLTQCKESFTSSDTLGRSLFDLINRAFDCMPVAAVLSEQLFCCHGGIPHTDTYPGSNAIDILNKLPRHCGGVRITTDNIEDALKSWTDEEFSQARWNGCNPCVAIPSSFARQDQQQHLLRFESRQRVLKAAYQVMWADPYSTLDAPDSGFHSNEDVPSGVPRPRVLYFTLSAVHDFFKKHGCTRIIRGHQGKRTGMHLQLYANVMTIFSDSCDHFKSAVSCDGSSLPSMTLCGCIFVDNDAIRCILFQPMAGLALLNKTQ
jgi:hypothetical protein